PDVPPSAAPVLSEDVARGYFRQLVAGVEHAHKHLVLHRDIKPDNILVDAQGKLCLGDFGLSAMLADADAMLHTQVGTVQYMAPEVVRGSSYATPADVWSLGATLYVMLVGTCPFGSRATTTAKTKIAGSSRQR
ncbi:MAG: protein kinase domain-containing protein, partial [Promethearchaeia archaeon]